MQAALQPAHVDGGTEDAEYCAFVERVSARYIQRTSNPTNRPVFTTDAPGLWEAYLQSFPVGTQRQHHNCAACRHFIEHFGSLVVIEDDLSITPAVWAIEDAPEEYKLAIAAMESAVTRAKVNGVFLSMETVFGEPITGAWRHLHAHNPAPFSHLDPRRTAGQAMAEKREDYRNVMRALIEFGPEVVGQAVTLLESEAMYRAEKTIGPAKWLEQLHADRSATTPNRRNNAVWRAVAKAPAGFCHPRSSMIGTLLEDLAAKKPLEAVRRAFAAKMRADIYQRPQAAPTAGAIAQAERAFSDMGLQRSLERRFAHPHEIQAIWRPRIQEAKTDGGASIFGRLTPKGQEAAEPMRLPATAITWEKFARTALPGAIGLEFFVPAAGNFAGLLTAVHPDAPPILQWDRPEQRNPVSAYAYVGGSRAPDWGLMPGRWTKVVAVTQLPSMWFGWNEHHGRGVILVLEGAQDQRHTTVCIFPEALRSELAPYRSVVEAFAAKALAQGRTDDPACGYCLSGAATWNAVVRVTADNSVREYMLERWD